MSSVAILGGFLRFPETSQNLASYPGVRWEGKKERLGTRLVRIGLGLGLGLLARRLKRSLNSRSR